MADSSDPTSQPVKTDDGPARSWVVPVTTVLVLAAAFCLYYFVYVGARREYLINRNFRALAALGDQVQRVLSTHASILEFNSYLAIEEAAPSHDRKKAGWRQFLQVRPEDIRLAAGERDLESRRDYVHYLAPTLDLTEVKVEANTPSSKPRKRLEIQRRDGRWQLILSALRHPNQKNDYLGSLEIRDLLKVPADSPFDDLILVSEDGTVVYQQKKAGPQFTTLASLLKAQIASGAKSGASEQPPGPSSSPASASTEDGGGKAATGGQNPDGAWQAGAIHLTDVMLAGTRYKLFAQPILLDVFSDEPTRNEPTHEWVLCGLRTYTALEWEALSISYMTIIGFTALFFAICMGGPMLKVLFINHRERFRLRELPFLSLFLILLAGVFTLTALQAVHFNLNDDTERQLNSLGEALSNNIHDDMQQMRAQLQAWCLDAALSKDFREAESHEVIRNRPDPEILKITKQQTPQQTPEPSRDGRGLKDAFINTAFWTDDDGHQIVKWSTNGYVTPMIDLSKQPIYTSSRRTYLDATGPPFHFDSILPPNKLQYLAALTVDTVECKPSLKEKDPKETEPAIRGDITGGLAFVTGQPFSLIDPILPPGYGFALVDETGLVLFHSDKTKNGRENFREESDWSKELYAATFGHSTHHSLRINYLGKDCRALMVPIPGVTEAPWLLIVYTDLTAERTFALQTMTMAATLLLAILAVPALLVTIWCLVRRPRFAPEWLWPNQHRMANYLYLICLYTLLILVFLFLAFRGPIEQIVISCVAFPYSAVLLTLWGFRRYPPATEGSRRWNAGGSGATVIALTAVSGVVFLSVLILHWSHLKALVLLPIVVAIAAVPLLDGPRRRYVERILRYRRRVNAAGRKVGVQDRAFFSYTNCYLLSVLLLLLLMGVLMPMALFRGCLGVERRLGLKQAQLHLASAVAERWGRIQDDCDSGEIGAGACKILKEKDSTVWQKIVLRPEPSRDRESPIVPHRKEPPGEELYEPWFRDLVYRLHHDYNSAAAETLGVIQDRVPPKGGTRSPDWSWHNSGSTVTLLWHGVHPQDEKIPEKGAESPSKKGESAEEESDIQIKSEIPATPNDALSGFGIATGVMLVMGGLLWMLVRKVFLIDLAPLKMTAVRELAESIRQGKNVLVLVPPQSDFEIEAPVKSLDLAKLATEARWKETMDVGQLPSGGVIQIRHFEYTNEVVTPDQKEQLLQRLINKGNTQIAAIMEVPASTEDYRNLFPELKLTVLDHRGRDESYWPKQYEVWLKKYEGPARDLIWRECKPFAALWPLGAQLAKDIWSEPIHSNDTIISEMLERADPYYRKVWEECTPDQKFVLSQLAEDGLVNPDPRNGRAIRQLIRRGFIVRDPEFRIMNESFRRFLRSATTDDLKQEWLKESRRSGWGKLHGVFFATMIAVGIFLLTTQNALWESSAAYVTGAFGALGTLNKLFNTYRGSSAEKAS